MNRLLTAALAFVFASPLAALAAEEGPISPIPKPNEGIMSSVATLVAFIVVAAVFGAVVWPKIAKGLSDRASKIKDEIESAEAARAQAKAALDQYERALADARVEAQKEIEKAKAQAIAIAGELRAKADVEMAAMKDKAIREIDSAKKQALTEIYAEASNLGTLVATKILQREINRGDQGRLVEDALSEMRQAIRA